jgi:hypothetical protein
MVDKAAYVLNSLGISGEGRAAVEEGDIPRLLAIDFTRVCLPRRWQLPPLMRSAWHTRVESAAALDLWTS